MIKQKIMLDMDDVITTGGFLYLINEYLHTNYKQEDFTDYYMQDVVPDKAEFFKWFLTKNRYDYCSIFENAKVVMEELSLKYDLYIGTAYLFPEIKNDCGIILKQKHDFLVKNFPFLKPEKFIFLANKSLLNCEIKIDDKVSNLDNADKKILFTSYHNKDISDEELNKKGIIRANNWLDIKKILL